MVVAPLKISVGSEYNGNKKMEGKSPMKRRVFVQTETGYVYGVELHRSDNAHTVKRRLQLALNVPTEESLLVYGDMVLRNDFSTIRNDSPLLLTRSFMHRSSSSPCFSIAGKDFREADQSGPVEILGCSNHISEFKQLVKDVVKAIEVGIDPIPVQSGLGGAYYFKNLAGENAVIVKPTDEEPFAPNNPKGFVGKALGQPGLKRSVRVGETGFREVAAYLLDYDHFANVPPTALVKIKHPIFNINDEVQGGKCQNVMQASKIASFQQFIPHDCDASDHGTSSFPVSVVHRIGILDVRILNTDRHAGNLLVRKVDGIGMFNQVELVPIDHGFCLPESLEDPYFEWIHWPQASVPFSEDELEYIDRLDPVHTSEMLRMELPMIRESCLRVLVLCTIFLKEAAGFGLCLAEIGEMMSREFRGHNEEPSELEMVCIQSKKLLKHRKTKCFENIRKNDKEFQFKMDSGEGLKMEPYVEEEFKRLKLPLGLDCDNICNSRVQLCENCEGQDEGEDGAMNVVAKELPMLGENAGTLQSSVPPVSKLSLFLRTVSLGEKTWRHETRTHSGRYLPGLSSGNRCVNEQLPASTSFVTLADMSEDAWVRFLENFQELLHSAFVRHKQRCSDSSQRPRFGTSCQF